MGEFMRAITKSKIHLTFAILASTAMFTCKNREGSQLASTAMAQSSNAVFTTDGKRVYPSIARIDAAIAKLNEAKRAMKKNDQKGVMRSLLVAKSQLALRPISAVKPEKTKTIKCTLKSQDGSESAVASMPFISSNSDDGVISSTGAVTFQARQDIEYSYSFDLVPPMEGEDFSLSVTFYENNSIQDEVSQIACEVSDKGEFCKETITASKINKKGFPEDEEQTVGEFSCVVGS